MASLVDGPGSSSWQAFLSERPLRTDNKKTEQDWKKETMARFGEKTTARRFYSTWEETFQALEQAHVADSKIQKKSEDIWEQAAKEDFSPKVAQGLKETCGSWKQVYVILSKIEASDEADEIAAEAQAVEQEQFNNLVLSFFDFVGSQVQAAKELMEKSKENKRREEADLQTLAGLSNEMTPAEILANFAEGRENKDET